MLRGSVGIFLGGEMIDLSNTVGFAVHGGGDSGGGVAGAVEGFLGFIESLLSLSPEAMFARLMPGFAVMENLHPLLVHFPIALLSLFFLLDLVGSLAGKEPWRRAADWFLYSGALFAGLTVIAGFVAAASVAHGGDVHEVMENHEHLGVSVFVLSLILAGWRYMAKGVIAGAANTLHLILSAVLAGLLVFTADLGASMVYGYGVAVRPVAETNKNAAALHQHGEDSVSDDHDHDDDDERQEFTGAQPGHQHHHNHQHTH